MGLRIVYGKPGSGKSSFCFSEIGKLLQEGKEKKIYIITPEQFSFTAERKLMEASKGKAVINAEVITLSRMAYRAVNEIGGVENTNLSKTGKAMLVFSILEKEKKNLKFLGKSDENIDLCITAMTEFKKHGITIENLKQEIENGKDVYLKSKLQDMTLIYESFEKQIKDKYIDETDLLTILAKNINKLEWLKDSIIYIDEFSGFTHQEYEILKELIKCAKKVTLTITIDKLEYAKNKDTDIYYSNKETLGKIIRLIDENNLKLEEPICLENCYRFKTEELKFLSEEICKTKSTKYEKNVENIKVFLAKNYYSEVEKVAKDINELITKKGLRYKDISIITKNIDTYSSLVRAIFRKYNIPVFIDEKRDLNQNIIVQYVLSILEILSKNFSRDSIFSYLKLGFNNIEKDEIFKLENYSIKWGIDYYKWKADFKYEIENKKEEVERLNEIRKQVIEPLEKLKQEIEKGKTAENITKSIYNFLINQNIEEKILNKQKELEDKNLLELSKEYKESYKIIINIFDEMVNIFKDEKMTIDEYQKIVKIGLANNGLGKIPGTKDQVVFGDVDRSRSHKVKVVFLIGLNDGVFPSLSKDEGFFNDKDREILKQDGIELAKGTIDNLYEDKFNIYKAFTTAEEMIYFSYSSSDSEGKSLRPSVYIYRLKKMFPKLQEKSDVIKKEYDLENIEVTYEELIENISHLTKNEKIDEIWYQIYKYYEGRKDFKEKLKKDIKAIIYTNMPDKIEKENIEKLYGNNLKTSISRLEKYRSCPFSYYLQYGLRLKEKEELKIKSFNTGSFMHETIDEFFSIIREENINLAELEENEILEIVSKIIDKNLKFDKNYIFTATARYKVLVERLKKIISKALKYIIETLIYSDFNEEGTEVEFSKNGKYKPILLELEDGKKVEITGKIDRIDTAKSDDRKILKNYRL